MKLGTDDTDKLCVGSTEVLKAYQGITEVWPPSGATGLPLQTREVEYSSLSTFSTISESGINIWIPDTEKATQANVGSGLRLWNGDHALNFTGCVSNGNTTGNRKYEFALSADRLAYWSSFWIRMKQDPGTGTYSGWIELEDGFGNIFLATQAGYNNIGNGTSTYEPSGRWVTHASGFKYQVEIYDNLDRPA